MKQKKTSRKKIITIAAIGLLVLSGSYAALAYVNKWVPFSNQDGSFEVDNQGRGVNPNKTESEKDDIKNLENNPDSKSTRPNTDVTPEPKVEPETKKQAVYVMMTSAEQSVDKNTITASGFVSNAVEQDGKCTYVFTLDNRIVKKTMGVIPGPNSTSCETLRIHKNDLGATGRWMVSIEYISSASQGIADGMALVVE